MLCFIIYNCLRLFALFTKYVLISVSNWTSRSSYISLDLNGSTLACISSLDTTVRKVHCLCLFTYFFLALCIMMQLGHTAYINSVSECYFVNILTCIMYFCVCCVIFTIFSNLLCLISWRTIKEIRLSNI